MGSRSSKPQETKNLENIYSILRDTDSVHDMSKPQETENDLKIISSILRDANNLCTNLLKLDIDMTIAIRTISNDPSPRQVELFLEDIANFDIQKIRAMSAIIHELKTRMFDITFLSSLYTDLQFFDLRPFIHFLESIPKDNLLENIEFTKQLPQVCVDVFDLNQVNKRLENTIPHLLSLHVQQLKYSTQFHD
jgi:hypothetical protein